MYPAEIVFRLLVDISAQVMLVHPAYSDRRIHKVCFPVLDTSESINCQGYIQYSLLKGACGFL